MLSPAPGSLRRARHLVSYWHAGHLVVHNYATGVRVEIDPTVAAVLHFFEDWRSPGEVRARFGVAPTRFARLVDATLLERASKTPAPVTTAALDAWAGWNPAAGFFHMSTRGERYLDPLETGRLLQRKARAVPVPERVKRYPDAKRLSFDPLRVERDLQRVLAERRTWRTFARTPLPLPVLGELLGWTSGVQQWAGLRGQGELPMKTSPSGGSRHPLELYVCARRVEGLEPGIYHYAAADHALERLARHQRPARVRRYLPGQFFFEGAAALVIFTAVFERYQWKYDEPRAYRAVFIEAGHQCQTFCLMATDLGLAPFCSMALADGAIETDLGIDGVSESAIYLAGVGTRPPGVASPSRPAGYAPLKVRSNPRVRS
ncbi:MAG TPA: SagB family peptide dehydrogenase [Vicinamibacterales bacterium]|nr:SagB family peptide dehydrogenase [Vicinamibacterales bacterium]